MKLEDFLVKNYGYNTAIKDSMTLDTSNAQASLDDIGRRSTDIDY